MAGASANAVQETRARTAQRRTVAGIAPDDPGLVIIRARNASPGRPTTARRPGTADREATT
jgi:hypothetical protein